MTSMKDRCHPHEGTTEVIVLLEWGQVHEETNKTKGSSLQGKAGQQEVSWPRTINECFA